MLGARTCTTSGSHAEAALTSSCATCLLTILDRCRPSCAYSGLVGLTASPAPSVALRVLSLPSSLRVVLLRCSSVTVSNGLDCTIVSTVRTVKLSASIIWEIEGRLPMLLLPWLLKVVRAGAGG